MEMERTDIEMDMDVDVIEDAVPNGSNNRSHEERSVVKTATDKNGGEISQVAFTSSPHVA